MNKKLQDKLAAMNFDEFSLWLEENESNYDLLPAFHNSIWFAVQPAKTARQILYNTVQLWCQKFPLP